jgi:hypothetical protein
MVSQEAAVAKVLCGCTGTIRVLTLAKGEKTSETFAPLRMVGKLELCRT